MKIYDLTRERYPQMYSPGLAWSYTDKLEKAISISANVKRLFQVNDDFRTLIDNIPVFLVESSMSGEYVAVPDCHCLIRVPEDKTVALNDDDFDIDEWVKSKENLCSKKEDPRERASRGVSIFDLLGVYVYTNNNDILPRKIFIWMDKIMDYVKQNTTINAYVTSNASALFDLVVYHEMGHALMDVEVYGLRPAPDFSYEIDYVYRFIEEGYANGIALSILLEGDKYNKNTFIEEFVRKQGGGYSYGLELLPMPSFDQWICVKVLFNYEFATLLCNLWKEGLFRNLNCAESIGHSGWIVVKDHCGMWSVIDLLTHEAVNGFKKYNSFWSFDDNGLCMVRLDQHHGYLYGYVNELGEEQIPVVYDHVYSFDDGIAVAKKNGCYGAIDVNNNNVIPFNLPYTDVRGFRNGRASVKDATSKWGAIDTKGKLIVPCTNENIVP